MKDRSVEEYLGAIYVLGEEGKNAKTNEIAKKLNVKPASVTEMLKKLASQGYIKHQPYYGATLTTKGVDAARKLKRKHRLLERFLHDVLGIKKDRVHEQACEMEHTLSDEAEKALDKILDHPKKCPDDGKLIPHAGKIRSKERRLINVSEGEKAKIVKLDGGLGFQSKLSTLGIRKGKEITVVAHEPIGGPIVIKTGNTTVTVGRGMASKIIVEAVK